MESLTTLWGRDGWLVAAAAGAGARRAWFAGSPGSAVLRGIDVDGRWVPVRVAGARRRRPRSLPGWRGGGSRRRAAASFGGSGGGGGGGGRAGRGAAALRGGGAGAF